MAIETEMQVQLKDYYTILEIQPSATIDDIKKAYRRLAHQYHPDKQMDDAYAAARFSIIKEAYETLTNPVRKEHYLQQRWYAKSQGKRGDTLSRSPVAVLQQLLELDRYTSRLDVHRMDRQGLADYLCDVLSGDNMDLINSFRDDNVNSEIVNVSLNIISYLPPALAARSYQIIRKIAPVDLFRERITAHETALIKNAQWESRKIWIVLLIVAAICALIIIIN